MQRNNTLKVSLLGFITAALVLAPISALLPKAHAATTPVKSYSECLTRYGKIKNTDRLHQKYIGEGVASRLEALQKLKTRAEALPVEAHRAPLVSAIDKDLEYLGSVRQNNVPVSDPTKLVQAYCEMRFKTGVYSFRTIQVKYMERIDKKIVADKKLQKALNSDYAKGVTKSKLAKEAEARYAHARSAIGNTLDLEEKAAQEVLSRTIDKDHHQNNAKPDFKKVDIYATYRMALESYYQANIIRKAANTYKQDKTLELVAVEFRDGNNQYLSNTPNKAVKAVVTIKGNKSAEGTTVLKRDGPKDIWKVVQDGAKKETKSSTGSGVDETGGVMPKPRPVPIEITEE